MPNCGPACVFCGRCGKDFSFLEHMKPAHVAPPGVASSAHAERAEAAPVAQRSESSQGIEDRKDAKTSAVEGESERFGS